MGDSQRRTRLDAVRVHEGLLLFRLAKDLEPCNKTSSMRDETAAVTGAEAGNREKYDFSIPDQHGLPCPQSPLSGRVNTDQAKLVLARRESDQIVNEAMYPAGEVLCRVELM